MVQFLPFELNDAVLLGRGYKLNFSRFKIFDKLTAKDEKVLEAGIRKGPNMRYYVM